MLCAISAVRVTGGERPPRDFGGHVFVGPSGVEAEVLVVLGPRWRLRHCGGCGALERVRGERAAPWEPLVGKGGAAVKRVQDAVGAREESSMWGRLWRGRRPERVRTLKVAM